MWALDPPLIERDWRAFRTEKINFFRFGYLWKLFDRVGSMSLDWRPGILPDPGQSLVPVDQVLDAEYF